MMDVHSPKLDVRLPVAPAFQAMEQNGGIQATAKPHQQLAVR
ncbi:hypothetical protein P832_03803 [Enterobacter kobei]|uniref:Uncharacterized protein n=1 Tax=Enterobacter agglomerans TaxID=549 RepID=A0A6N3CYI3_ENTAG|nr:hypothetical protein L371_03474 [Enterobacter sp. MGH 25]ESN19576.1 hypothetical protein L368_04392 [Enterobacter sp. MGH 22]EUL88723.1 hypothetical protein P827_03256 [Enterobacter kobei]EUM38456.1 hypothetical protein L383_04629 [Enterobacter sp. MGH 37]CAE7586543.1 hypothetical protein AI2762V1_0827 [Enterobacter cloacae]GFM10249.1 hypothetical protein NCT2013_26670 [Enterobacter sp. M4-VN]